MDGELVEQARRGDRAAYDAIVRWKVETVYRTARAILGNDQDAEDATQDALIAGWRRLPSLREPDRFDAWLGRITVNECRMVLRRRRGKALVVLPVISEQKDRRASSFDSAAVSADAFDRAFDRLSMDHRAVLALHHLEDLPVVDVAARLGIPVGTVKSRLHGARTALERSLAREGFR